MWMSPAAVGRTLGLALLLGTVAGCASQQSSYVSLSDPARIRAIFDSLDEARIEQELAARDREGGPRVDIWTDEGVQTLNRVRASFRLRDDAYVAAFSVGRDGRITLVYPESPEDPTLLRADHVYRLPETFPGFVTPAAGYERYARYSQVQFGNYGSPLRDAGGYIFIVASWSPLRLDRLEELGLLDTYRNVNFGGSLRPFDVMHQYAEALVPRGRSWYTVDHAYYRLDPFQYGYTSCGPSAADAQLLGRLLSNQYVHPFVYRSILADLAMEPGCGSHGLYRAYIMALSAGFGRVGTPAPIPPTLPIPQPPPATGGTDSTTGNGSKPAPPENPRRDGEGRPRADDCAGEPKCDRPERPPRRERRADDEEEIDLGGRRGRRDDERGRGAVRWAEMTHRPIEERRDPTGATRRPRERSSSWESARNGWAGGSRNPTRRGTDAAVERPRSQSARQDQPRSERPRQEQARRDQPRHERPRAEQPRHEGPRTERRPEPVRQEQPRVEPPRQAARVERVEQVAPKPVPVQP